MYQTNVNGFGSEVLLLCRFLLCAYGVACAQFADDSEEMYEWIRDTIRSSDRFKFDYVMRSVTTEVRMMWKSGMQTPGKWRVWENLLPVCFMILKSFVTHCDQDEVFNDFSVMGCSGLGYGSRKYIKIFLLFCFLIMHNRMKSLLMNYKMPPF